MTEDQILELEAKIQARRDALQRAKDRRSSSTKLKDKYKEVKEIKPILKDVVG